MVSARYNVVFVVDLSWGPNLACPTISVRETGVLETDKRTEYENQNILGAVGSLSRLQSMPKSVPVLAANYAAKCT